MRQPARELPGFIADDAEAVRPLSKRSRHAGTGIEMLRLPISDADEEQLEAALRAAVADEPTLRILHLAAFGPAPASSTESL